MNKLPKVISILSEYKELNLNDLNTILGNLDITFHLAIMHQPYLINIINGCKTIESRFSKVKAPPFGKVHKNDIILFKKASGNIIAVSLVKDVKYFSNLSSKKVNEIFFRYKKELTAQDDFIKSKYKSKYATLIFIAETKKLINPIKLRKKDRRAWIVFERDVYGKLF
jgi:hypothetical protein